MNDYIYHLRKLLVNQKLGTVGKWRALEKWAAMEDNFAMFFDFPNHLPKRDFWFPTGQGRTKFS
jgi:hypothetical protein